MRGIDNPLAISVPEAAKLLGVCPKIAYDLCHSEGFPAFKVNGRTVVSRSGLERWVEKQAEAQAGMAVGML